MSLILEASIGNLTYPYAMISSVVNNPGSGMAYVGSVEINGHSVYEIRVMRPVADRPDPRMRLTQDYFIDGESYLVVRVADSTHLANPPSNFPHAIDYGEYRNISGLLIPMSISETFMGSSVWTVHLSDIRFNIGLTDSPFAVE